MEGEHEAAAVRVRKKLIDPFRRFRAFGSIDIELPRKNVRRTPESGPPTGCPDEVTGISEDRAAWDRSRAARLSTLWAKSDARTRQGRPFDLLRHEWEDIEAVRTLVRDAVTDKDFRRIAQYRRACRAASIGRCMHEHEYPTFLTPERKARKSAAPALKKDRTLTLHDPTHPLHGAHEVRQVFEATGRRDEQKHQLDILTAAYGRPPAGLTLRDKDRPGRKPTKATSTASRTQRALEAELRRNGIDPKRADTTAPDPTKYEEALRAEFAKNGMQWEPTVKPDTKAMELLER
jgi:hypothetical protein